MKKILSLALAGVMMFSALPVAYATNVYENPDANTEMGTNVSYNAEDPDGDGVANNKEEYTVTVPASLAPGESGNVIASGTWASNRKLTVTADANVVLANSINAADKKTLDVTFAGIELAGSNTAAVSDTKAVKVAEMPSDALFGTWSGTFNYTVVMGDVASNQTITFAIDGIHDDENDGYDSNNMVAKVGMTYKEWLSSEYYPSSLPEYHYSGFMIYNEYLIYGDEYLNGDTGGLYYMSYEDGTYVRHDDVIQNGVVIYVGDSR